MHPRFLTDKLLAALSDTPVAFLAGARQVGKSTLARQIAGGAHPARYITLDDVAILAAARRDPVGFVAGLEGDVVLDEVQRAPELLLAIKAAVDRDRQPGRFLLTGSANVLALPHVSDPLAGRMSVLSLWPLSQGELTGVREGFLEAVFQSGVHGGFTSTLTRAELCARITTGGYPDAVARVRPDRRSAWFEDYLSTLLHRDVRELAAIEGLAQLPQVLGLLAARSGSQVSLADISRTAAIPQSTLRRYVALLEALYLVQPLPAWSGNLTTRLLKSPKRYLTDTGLMADLLGLDGAHVLAHPDRLGPLLEAFVVNEVTRQAGWHGERLRLHHFRTEAGREVDLVIEDRRGRLVAIEVKAASALSGRDLKGIEAFAAAAGNAFHRGIVLYTGTETVPFAANIHALPIDALWGG